MIFVNKSDPCAQKITFQSIKEVLFARFLTVAWPVSQGVAITPTLNTRIVRKQPRALSPDKKAQRGLSLFPTSRIIFVHVQKRDIN